MFRLYVEESWEPHDPGAVAYVVAAKDCCKAPVKPLYPIQILGGGIQKPVGLILAGRGLYQG
jgi:hypothetical protein